MTLSIHLRRPLITFATIAVSANAFGQAPNLRELAREHALRHPSSTLDRPVPPEHLDAKSVADLSRDAAAVVTGKLVRKGTYLSPREDYIFTDYEIRDVTVLAGQLSVRTSSVPGQVSLPVITLWGGEVVVEGVRFRDSNQNFAAIEEGVPYLIFLRPSMTGETGRYSLHNGAIFEIGSQQVKPLLKRGNQVFSWAEDVTVPDLIARIQSAGKAR